MSLRSERDRLAPALDAAQKRIVELEMSQLRRTRDSRTGVLRIEPFRDHLVEELGRTRRHGLHGALIVMQVDRLADVHREHGFVAGDQLLRALVAALRGDPRTPR